MVEALATRNVQATRRGPRLITPYGFQEAFHDDVAQATNQALFQTMTFLMDGDFPKSVTDDLCRAANRDLKVVFNYDDSSLVSLDGHLSLTPVPIRRRRWNEDVLEHERATRLRLDELEIVGAKVRPQRKLNPVTRNLPFLGRRHDKLAVVDQRAWILNVNLTQAHFSYPAFVYETDSEEVVDRVGRIIQEDDPWTKKDGTIPCGDGVTLIVDKGRPFQSDIYNYANNMVLEGADQIVVWSTYLPHRRLMTNLIGAERRGSRVIVVTSEQDVTKGRFSPYEMARRTFEERIRGRRGFDLVRVEGIIGARGLMVDEKFLTGSHTLSEYGMWFAGTKEAAVVSEEEQVLLDANRQLTRHLAGNS